MRFNRKVKKTEKVIVVSGVYEVFFWKVKESSRCEVKLSPKTLKIALLEPCRAIYGAECKAFENGDVQIPLYSKKTARGIRYSPHHVEVWSEGDFTVYFYREGIPTQTRPTFSRSSSLDIYRIYRRVDFTLL